MPDLYVGNIVNERGAQIPIAELQISMTSTGAPDAKAVELVEGSSGWQLQDVCAPTACGTSPSDRKKTVRAL